MSILRKTAEVKGQNLATVRFGNGGSGSVVGLLKVGRKKLFLLDEVGEHLNHVEIMSSKDL